MVMNSHNALMEGAPFGAWNRFVADYVRSGLPDLTNRQMAILLTVVMSSGPHTVRGLAAALNLSKPVITRALNKLSELGYLRRQRDLTDRRNVIIAPTDKGAQFLEHIGTFGQSGGQSGGQSDNDGPTIGGRPQ